MIGTNQWPPPGTFSLDWRKAVWALVEKGSDAGISTLNNYWDAGNFTSEKSIAFTNLACEASKYPKRPKNILLLQKKSFGTDIMF